MQKILWFLTGGPLPVFLFLAGSFFLFYLKGQPFRSPKKLFSALIPSAEKGKVSSFRAMTLALAGTLGVGNIVGVSNAIAAGGAGAVFWMWISALAAMMLKYAEILLAVKHRKVHPDGSFYGGAPYYIFDLLKERKREKTAKFLSAFFALLLIGNAFFMGSSAQVGAVASAAKEILGLSPAICGLLFCLLLLPWMGKRVTTLSGVTEYLVPIMSLGYLVLSGAVFLIRKERLPAAFASIFRDAFSGDAIGGGIFGFLTSESLRIGCMRGLFSNEGGTGTSPTAHAGANASSPAAQGVFGILEVFIDTILLCTVTALVILVSPAASSHGDGMMLTVQAFSATLGDWSSYFLFFAIFAFAFATVLCWIGYGKEAMSYLFPRSRPAFSFLPLFLLCCFFGAVFSLTVVFTLSDVVMTLLTLTNLFALLLGRREIASETKIFLSDFSCKSPSDMIK